jgi:hypothetical protein
VKAARPVDASGTWLNHREGNLLKSTARIENQKIESFFVNGVRRLAVEEVEE